MKIDLSLQDIGSRCGVDVEALYQKYAQEGAPEQKRGDPDTAAFAPTYKATRTDGLDRFRLCKVCHGYGLVKETYNHQIKEVNCGECDGEGIIEKMWKSMK